MCVSGATLHDDLGQLFPAVSTIPGPARAGLTHHGLLILSFTHGSHAPLRLHRPQTSTQISGAARPQTQSCLSAATWVQMPSVINILALGGSIEQSDQDDSGSITAPGQTPTRLQVMANHAFPCNLWRQHRPWFQSDHGPRHSPK